MANTLKSLLEKSVFELGAYTLQTLRLFRTFWSFNEINDKRTQ
jgi:hypothetical protein